MYTERGVTWPAVSANDTIRWFSVRSKADEASLIYRTETKNKIVVQKKNKRGYARKKTVAF